MGSQGKGGGGGTSKGGEVRHRSYRVRDARLRGEGGNMGGAVIQGVDG